MELLNGNDLYKMFEYGTVYIVKQRRHLNDINVFPVADGDTGNNLVHTLKTILRESENSASFYEQLDSISQSALIGARGNSGVIFAQFINGLRKASPVKENIEIHEFIMMVEEGYKYTYNSLSNPVEGTILTLMKEFGDALKRFWQEGIRDLQELFSSVYNSSLEMLKKTPQLLGLLQKSNVVDSGALGFTLFIKGISSYFSNEELNVGVYENVEIEDKHHFEGEITYRYCTEGLLERGHLEVQSLKRDLEMFGDSIVIADGARMTRVHIHTNHPDKVFQKLSDYGQLETQKVDDMMLEMNLKNSSSRRVLVTDSIADLDPGFVERNNIVVIPVNLDFGGVNYLDKVTITNEYIFKTIETLEEYPKTATPTIKYISNLFSKLYLLFDEIIVVSVSEGLSSTFRVIQNEANNLVQKGKQIHVVDSLNNSVSEGLLVKKTAELMKTNLETKEIVNIINNEKNKTEILVCLETFKYAVKSGRVPKVVGKIGSLIKMRPIMTLKEGKGSAFGFAFSQKGITKKIKKHIQRDLEQNKINDYAIVHVENEKLAKQYAEEFTELIGKKPSYIASASSAIAIFSGKGTVAIGYIKED